MPVRVAMCDICSCLSANCLTAAVPAPAKPAANAKPARFDCSPTCVAQRRSERLDCAKARSNRAKRMFMPKSRLVIVAI